MRNFLQGVGLMLAAYSIAAIPFLLLLILVKAMVK